MLDWLKRICATFCACCKTHAGAKSHSCCSSPKDGQTAQHKD